MYIHERDQWPNFRWNEAKITKQLASLRLRQGKLIGRMEALGITLRSEAVLRTLTEDVLKTSEIEGEKLDPDQVRSSLACRLGIEIGALTPSDCDVEGVVEMMLDATQNYAKPLDAERLFGWHAALFPTGRSGMSKIVVGNWRDDSDGPMQVVSGPIGRERVHFEAPKAKRLPAEMKAFIYWYNANTDLDAVLKAALAHLWFVTIHPFTDGNGRIARAIADMSLARSEESANRFYSMSAQIKNERNVYYDILEHTQKGDLDITDWLTWFLDCLDHAFVGAETILASVLRRANFWKKHAQTNLNDRQRLMLNKLLNGFEGKLTSSKWAKITKSSQPTAGRDIEQLIALDILRKDEAGGRSTSYSLVVWRKEHLGTVARHSG
ncbi:MAG: Fic family protein [Hyphomonas sp.]|uniref:Fic family protein n=1 Tax=Hyphomonas sp. TaxID=87 RepID=UPI0017DA1FEA|nr:Fic family protein [Hyphomonas sp.]MBA3067908.1 Fic family protein [Hyphomonas sp.]MBU3922388.1 Fic family protein [Alphaproteobacteria bacterium]MBU4061245.1 Fic family protein [Alphaproteobacteria bacterium]MBU4162498.1 Fic family protein [Alphaproteobacteria bacterium]